MLLAVNSPEGKQKALADNSLLSVQPIVYAKLTLCQAMVLQSMTYSNIL